MPVYECVYVYEEVLLRRNGTAFSSWASVFLCLVFYCTHLKYTVPTSRVPCAPCSSSSFVSLCPVFFSPFSHEHERAHIRTLMCINDFLRVKYKKSMVFVQFHHLKCSHLQGLCLYEYRFF